MTTEKERLRGVAIIGMAGRFPGARNTSQFWENLCNGVESVSFFPMRRPSPRARLPNW